MLEIIFSDISNYMDSYFLKSIALGLICAFVMLTLLNAFKRLEKDEISERRIIVKTTAFFLWIVYGYMVLGIAFLCKTAFSDTVFDSCRQCTSFGISG